VFIKESVERVAEERTLICKGCSHNSDHQKKYNNYKTIRPDFHCTICGCGLHMKTRALSQECPAGKWKSYVSQEEEYEINKKLEDGAQSN
jgi:hypothetical protein